MSQAIIWYSFISRLKSSSNISTKNFREILRFTCFRTHWNHKLKCIRVYNIFFTESSIFYHRENTLKLGYCQLFCSRKCVSDVPPQTILWSSKYALSSTSMKLLRDNFSNKSESGEASQFYYAYVTHTGSLLSQKMLRSFRLLSVQKVRSTTRKMHRYWLRITTLRFSEVRVLTSWNSVLATTCVCL